MKIQVDDTQYICEINPNCDGSFDGCLFEELPYMLLSIAKNRILTLTEDDGKLYLSSGIRFVNRLGFFIVDKPIEKEFCELFDLDSEIIVD